MWKIKHRGLKDSYCEDDKPQEVSKSKDPLLPEEATSSVSQLATKVQGASLKSWKEVASLFNKDDEHKLLTDNEPKRISGDDGRAYRSEICQLVEWCHSNNLTLNVRKTKELIVDFRKSKTREHLPILTEGSEAERVSSFKFLDVKISEDLTWSQHIDAIIKEGKTVTILQWEFEEIWTTVKVKEDVKMEKKPSFWDTLGIKQNSASKSPTEGGTWEPQVTMENPYSNLTDSCVWSDWASESSSSSKYTTLESETNVSGSRWGIITAGKLPGIRRRSKGNLTDCWEELE
ncbi:testis development-related protein isoform X1 [Mobula birostris]|uniref:testis development-related protein isoform X1 n=1 Tax=Mobula birostris TaxID=1983395 RepID=UPI003B28C564